MSLESEENLKQSLPNLVPQKTNVLTGASTNYYSQHPQVWSNTYQSLIRY